MESLRYAWVGVHLLQAHRVLCEGQGDKGIRMVRYQGQKFCNVSDPSGNIYNVSCASMSGDPRPEVPSSADTKGGKETHNETDIKYGLVPAFLIGASSVILLYILFHCLYLHCYVKPKKRKLAREAAQKDAAEAETCPALMAVDHRLPAHLASVVTYDNRHQQAEIQGQMFTPPTGKARQTKAPNSMATQGHTGVFTLLTPTPPRRVPEGAETEMSEGPGAAAEGAGPVQRTSICFVPVATSGNTAAANGEWAPVPGYLYSAMLVTGDPPDGQPSAGQIGAGDAASIPLNCQGNLSSSRIVLVPAGPMDSEPPCGKPSGSAGPTSPASRPRSTSPANANSSPSLPEHMSHQALVHTGHATDS